MISDLNGLRNFIKEVRSCKNKSDENARVVQEIAKINTKFLDKHVSGYERKKCLWKIVFLQLIGYESDLGLIQAISLLSSKKPSEKQAGYIFFSNQKTNILFPN